MAVRALGAAISLEAWLRLYPKRKLCRAPFAGFYGHLCEFAFDLTDSRLKEKGRGEAIAVPFQVSRLNRSIAMPPLTREQRDQIKCDLRAGMDTVSPTVAERPRYCYCLLTRANRPVICEHVLSLAVNMAVIPDGLASISYIS